MNTFEENTTLQSAATSTKLNGAAKQECSTSGQYKNNNCFRADIAIFNPVFRFSCSRMHMILLESLKKSKQTSGVLKKHTSKELSLSNSEFSFWNGFKKENEGTYPTTQQYLYTLVMIHDYNPEAFKSIADTIADKCGIKVPKNSVKKIYVHSSDKGFSDYRMNILLKVYEEQKMSKELIKRAIYGVVAWSLQGGNLHPHLNSQGSKMEASGYFNFEMLQFFDENNNLISKEDLIYVEPGARSGISGLVNTGNFSKIMLSDVDYRFVNYFNILHHYPYELVAAFACMMKDSGLYGAEDSADTREKAKLLFAKVDQDEEVNEKDSLDKKITAAAALLIKINFSHNGNNETINYVKIVKSFMNESKLDNVCKDLVRTSFHMSNVEYTHSDYETVIKANKGKRNCLMQIDLPYFNDYGISSSCYRNEFVAEDAKKIFKLLKDAKCKVIIYHRQDPVFHDWISRYKHLTLTGFYESNGYRTDIVTMNISPSEYKAFNFGKNGGFYEDYLGNMASSLGITCEKGVL